MSLLRDIQSSLLRDETDLPTILLKLRFLAARLGSEGLTEWIKHESEGYPKESKIPPYRVVGVSYSGTFSGPFGSGINNAQIPPYLIEKFAGKNWTNHEVRDSIAAIDAIVEDASSKDGALQINASNLILLLQGKIYEDYACNEIRGILAKSSFVEIQYVVRNRIVDLTLELEKSVPNAASISFDNPKPSEQSHADKVNHIYQQVVYGDFTSISHSGTGPQVVLNSGERDSATLIKNLMQAGMPQGAASELAKVVASEEPSNNADPLGTNAKEWIKKNLRKATHGAWEIASPIVKKIITEIIIRYYRGT